MVVLLLYACDCRQKLETMLFEKHPIMLSLVWQRGGDILEQLKLPHSLGNKLVKRNNVITC